MAIKLLGVAPAAALDAVPKSFVDGAVRGVSANTTANNRDLILVNAAGGAVTITVPVAAGARVMVKKTDSSANAVIVNCSGNVDGDPSASLIGQDTSAVFVGDGTNVQIRSAYVPGQTSALQSFTPTWTNLTLGNGTTVAEYQLVNKVLTLRYWVIFGSTTTITGNVSVALPPGFTALSDGQPQDINCRIGYGATGTSRTTGFATINAGGTSLTPYEPSSPTVNTMVQVGSYGQTFGTNSVLSIYGQLLVN